MRTAFCFSGELRSIDKTYPYLKERIMDKFTNYDIFYHTWGDDPDIHKLNIIESDKNTRNVLIQPRVTLDEKTYNSFKRDEVNVQGMLRQLYCLEQSNNLKSEYERTNNFVYDCVVRIRPDIQPVNHTKLESGVNEWNMQDFVYTTDHDDHLGFNDRFYFSNSENMDALSNRRSILDDYFKLGGIIHYESFFQWSVWRNHLKMCRSSLEFVLLRTNGDLSSELGKNISEFKFI